MNDSLKRHSQFLSLIFILNCLSKASIIRIFYNVSLLFLFICLFFFELALLVKTLTNFNIIYPKNYRTHLSQKLQDVETDYLLDISLKP